MEGNENTGGADSDTEVALASTALIEARDGTGKTKYGSIFRRGIFAGRQHFAEFLGLFQFVNHLLGQVREVVRRQFHAGLNVEVLDLDDVVLVLQTSFAGIRCLTQGEGAEQSDAEERNCKDGFAHETAPCGRGCLDGLSRPQVRQQCSEVRDNRM